MRKLLVALALLVASPASAQITVPYSFSANTTILSARVNANFNKFADALNRTGGTITGNIAVDNGITIDGIDISAALCTTCDVTFEDLTLTSPDTGITVAGVNIVNSSGQIPAISSTYFTSLSGANLTGLNATQLTTGTIPLARLGSVVTSSYTPAFTGSGNSVGNGTLTGAYVQIGKVVYWQLQLTFGSTTTGGTGGWTLSLPVAAEATWPVMGHVQMLDGSNRYLGSIVSSTTTTVLVFNNASPIAGVSTTVPFTWGTGDTLTIVGWYVAA